MKKYLAIITSMIFVLGFAAAAFAIHAEIPSETQSVVAKGDTQITLGGEIRFRGAAEKLSPAADATKSYYDGRVRLSVDAQLGPNVQGKIHLESGDADTTDLYTWGRTTANPNNDTAKGTYTTGNSKRGDLRILEGWIQYKTDYAGLKVGHMPLFLGNKLFFDHSKFGDDAILVFATPTKGIELAALTIKLNDQVGSNSQDQDAYVVLGGYKSDMFSIGGDLTWVVINQGATFQPFAGFGVTGASDVYNLGVRADVNLSILRIYGDVELQAGTLCKNCTDALGNSFEADVKGWAALGGVDINLAPVLKLNGEFGTGTGQDDSNDFTRFITSLGADQHFTYVYDYRIAGAVDKLGGAGQYGGIANTTYIKLAASGNITEPLSYYVAGYYLMATEAPSVFKDPVTGAITINPTTGPSEDADNYIGTEVDARIAYKLAKNLTYWVEGGYLASGDYYKDTTGQDDAMWAVRHGIQLVF